MSVEDGKVRNREALKQSHRSRITEFVSFRSRAKIDSRHKRQRSSGWRADGVDW